MKKSIVKWQIEGFIFTGIMGVLLHFLFDWSGENAVIASFSAVNESVWEHMKIIFFPMFIFALVESKSIMGKKNNNFWCVKLIGIVLGVTLIPGLYYFINGAFGTTPDWINIAIFFIAALASCFVENYLFKLSSLTCKSSQAALAILWLIALTFVMFTFAPPQIPLFEDPITGGYGF